MGIVIRTARKSDVPEVLGLLYELGRPKPKNDSEFEVFQNLVKKQLSDADKTLLVAVRDETLLVGLVSVNFLTRLNRTSPEMYLPELIVTQKYQRQGIGKRLIDACISLANEKNCFRIRLESGNFRAESHKFYTALGFESNSTFFSKSLGN